ncbi:MAG: galactonate dehydratase [Armatimonadota bacterium]
MRITGITTFAVEPRWLFVKMETDEGVTGWGECLGDKAFVVAEAVRSYEHALIGEDPARIMHLVQRMYRHAFWRGGPILNAAISGIEMALWDIQGKWLGVPAYQLLGGKVRERIRVYRHIGSYEPTQVAEQARQRVQEGYTAVKFCPLPPLHPLENPAVIERAVQLVAAARDAVGNEVDILLDFHGRAMPAIATTLEYELRPYRPFFIEEPVLPENVDALAQVASKAVIPIATGERLFTRYGFRQVLEKGAASVLQPDPCICGGIFETRHIAGMAETYYASLAPHNPYGPINLAACLQIDACSPNFVIQEFVHLGEGYLKTPFTVRDGYIDVTDAPGLGIEVDEEYLRAHPLTPKPDPGFGFFHSDDGSVAEW